MGLIGQIIQAGLTGLLELGTASEYFRLPQELLYINMRGNNVSGILPATLGNLSSLTLLILQDNKLEGEIPSSLGNLSNLNQLYLSNNQLTGSIPGSVAGCCLKG
jgi:Leucine-rich repeat (LRR) protein